MEEQVSKFDPSKMMEGVKDRIKATFVGLIPDDAWDAMVKKEVDEFFQPRAVKYSKSQSYGYSSYNGGGKTTYQEEYADNISPFRQIIWDLCAEATVKVMREKFASEYFTNMYDTSNPEKMMHPKMQEMIQAMIPDAINQFFTRVAFNQSNDIRQRLMNQ